MSRSIHETRKMLAEIMKHDFGGNLRGQTEKSRINTRLNKKRRIKSSVRLERDGLTEPTPPTPIDHIPIVVRDEGPFIHYPATPEDVRAIMHRLPPGSCDKLRSIEFTIDRHLSEPDTEIDRKYIGSVDPFIGRFKVQRYPGIYTSGTLGLYDAEAMNIQLYGYAYAPDLPNRLELELMLKCRILSTFVHELAHHLDRTMRMARGRWRMDHTRKGEDYAELWQNEWDCNCVVPFIQKQYPVEVNRLLDWLENETGIRLTLPMLYGERLDGVPCCVDLASVCQAIAAREPKNDIRKTLISEMLDGYFYERAQAEIDRLLPGHESDPELLILGGRVFFGQDQFAAAHDWFRRAVAADQQNTNARIYLAITSYEQKLWPETIINAEQAIQHFRKCGETGPFAMYWVKVKAMLGMGDLGTAETAIDETEAIFSRLDNARERIDALDGIARLRKLLRDNRAK